VGGLPVLELGAGLKTSHPKKSARFEKLHRASKLDGEFLNCLKDY
jgi:hypothetical protein